MILHPSLCGPSYEDVPVDLNQKVYAKPGVRYTAPMPYSEVCMHMRIAGKLMQFELLDRGPDSWSYRYAVQLYKDGYEYSGAILTGEGGLYEEERGVFYFHPAA